MNFKNGIDKPDYDERALKRLLSKTVEDVTTGCWSWVGADSGVRKNRPTNDVYGRIKYKNTNWQSHKLAYTLIVGSIPDGLIVDHLCKNTLCANPDHMELVTIEVSNQRRRPFSRTK